MIMLFPNPPLQLIPIPRSQITMNTLPLIIILLFSLIFPLTFSANLTWYDDCGAYFSCGNTTKVGYPFWAAGLRPRNCGYPGLEFACESNSTITIVIAGMKYRVLDINQNTQILTIAREDFWQGICLQEFANTTLDFTLFEYGPKLQNVTALYGCPSSYSGVQGEFTCKLNGVNDSTGFPEFGALGPNGCTVSVVVPVMEPLTEQIGNASLDDVIKHGFVVKYKVEEFCVQCEKSRGRCGFDLVGNRTSCLCPDGNVGYTTCGSEDYGTANGVQTGGTWKEKIKRTRIVGSIVLALFLATGGVGVVFYFKKRYPSTNKDIEAFLQSYKSTPIRYTYKHLKKITNSFKERLGEGGYGTVYKGKLPNGSLVAVKLLKKSKGNAEEFINEVASIGRTNHVNVVKLLGFCVDGHKRALVYDFMPNGSLDKFIYDDGDQTNPQSLAVDDLFRIVVGVARGLEYLHQGCNTRILHFDIKPHNILLDENLRPKISDFGLAKPCMQKNSIISMSGARGTIGYIAPEVFLRNFGGVSYKSDVYSYGMLVLEMLGCRRIESHNILLDEKDSIISMSGASDGARIESSSEQYFPQWIYNRLEQDHELHHEGITNGVEKELERKMVIVSLWCIQTHPSSRPTMTTVVEMLEGTTEQLQVPPMPSLATPPKSRQSFSTALTSSTSATTPLNMDPIDEGFADEVLT